MECPASAGRRPAGSPHPPANVSACGSPQPRRVRELVGDDGGAVVDFMYRVLCDESERTETRMDAGKWLVERVWGRPALAVELTGEDPFDGNQAVRRRRRRHEYGFDNT
jgi:hypothetical protein